MDFARVEVSSQSANAQALEATAPNAHFAINYTPALSFGDNDLDVAVKSLSINVGPQLGKDSLVNLDIYVLSNLVSATTTTANSLFPVLVRTSVSQVNERVKLDFSQNLSWSKVAGRRFAQLQFQVVTDTFIAAQGGSREFANIHTPVGSNATLIELVFRKRQPMLGDFEGVGLR